MPVGLFRKNAYSSQKNPKSPVAQGNIKNLDVHVQVRTVLFSLRAFSHISTQELIPMFLMHARFILYVISTVICNHVNRFPQSMSIRNAVDYYSSCLNKKSIEARGDQPLKDVIKQYNSWPVTDMNFTAANWNWTDTFIRVHKYLAMAPVFNMYVGSDLKNSSVNVITVGVMIPFGFKRVFLPFSKLSLAWYFKMRIVKSSFLIFYLKERDDEHLIFITS